MERVQALGLTEEEYRAVGSLVLQGIIKPDTFCYFNDEGLATNLRVFLDSHVKGKIELDKVCLLL